MDKIIELLKLPLAFVLVGIVYEWWWPNPLLKRLTRDRTDKYWSFALIALVGVVAWILYQLIVLLFPDIQTLMYNPVSHTKGDILRIVSQGLLDAAIGFFLLLPIHLLLLKFCKQLPETETIDADASPKGASISVKQTRTDGTITEETEYIISNVYLETEKSGKFNIGVPGVNGTLAIEFGPIKPGGSVQLIASTVDPTGEERNIPISGSISLPDPTSGDEPNSVTGSGVQTENWDYRYSLKTGYNDDLKLFAGPETDSPGSYRFFVASPPGTLQKIVKTSREGENKDKGETGQ